MAASSRSSSRRGRGSTPLSERLNSTRCSQVDCHLSISKGTSFIRLAASRVVRINLLGTRSCRGAWTRERIGLQVPIGPGRGAVRREPTWAFVPGSHVPLQKYSVYVIYYPCI